MGSSSGTHARACAQSGEWTAPLHGPPWRSLRVCIVWPGRGDMISAPAHQSCQCETSAVCCIGTVSPCASACGPGRWRSGCPGAARPGCRCHFAVFLSGARSHQGHMWCDERESRCAFAGGSDARGALRSPCLITGRLICCTTGRNACSCFRCRVGECVCTGTASCLGLACCCCVEWFCDIMHAC